MIVCNRRRGNTKCDTRITIKTKRGVGIHVRINREFQKEDVDAAGGCV